jgi:hypothetical protein
MSSNTTEYIQKNQIRRNTPRRIVRSEEYLSALRSLKERTTKDYFNYKPSIYTENYENLTSDIYEEEVDEVDDDDFETFIEKDINEDEGNKDYNDSQSNDSDDDSKSSASYGSSTLTILDDEDGKPYCHCRGADLEEIPNCINQDNTVSTLEQIYPPYEHDEGYAKVADEEPLFPSEQQLIADAFYKSKPFQCTDTGKLNNPEIVQNTNNLNVKFSHYDGESESFRDEIKPTNKRKRDTTPNDDDMRSQRLEEMQNNNSTNPEEINENKPRVCKKKKLARVPVVDIPPTLDDNNEAFKILKEYRGFSDDMEGKNKALSEHWARENDSNFSEENIVSPGY